MKRNLILRGYQEPAVDHIMKTPICVLAIAPNGGKTEISIEVISLYLRKHPTTKVLILTHSTNVLKDNYYDRLEDLNLDFTYSKDFDPNTSVHISLPNSEKKITGQYDFVIVDEAHENYFAAREQRLIRNINPSKQLLLTGTPSIFIRKGEYDIFFIAANQIPEIYSAKLNLELVASNYKWLGNYNLDHEVKASFMFNVDDTRKTLEAVMEKLLQRLQTKFTPVQFNHPSWVSKFKKWAFTYDQIGKTMIACKNIAQANMVYDILKNEHNINVGLSHSENDKDSGVISEFKDGVFNVLVVVNRGRLGFSDVNLMNLIDMTGTHNPDIIFQMFCRVLRGTPDTQKYYMKVTPKELHNMSLTHLSVCAGLMLTDMKFLKIYNGRNFNDIQIPIIRGNRPTSTGSSTGGSSGGSRPNPVTRNILPEFTHDVIDTMKSVLHDAENVASIYKMTTMGNVKYTLGHSKKRPTLTKEDIFESCRGNLLLVD
jgi:hypothetical protein|tara:strand:- start:1145 stop:2596 length:1452 start_codon:yes stop_codon:yes gene_type:complete